MTWARSTYFLTTSTASRKLLLQNKQFAELLIDCWLHHREQHRFDLHAFVVMPDHVPLLLTPGDGITLERAAQFVKGTFSFQLNRERGYSREVWSSKYHDERIRTPEQCQDGIAYIENNPVRRGLSPCAALFPFSSASSRWEMDPLPQWLKPLNKTTFLSAT
jgi:putative transposase